MTKAAYFDCFSGASGDMILAALIDAGADLEKIRSELASLGLQGYELKVSQVKRASLRANRVEVSVSSDDQPNRHLSDILTLIDNSKLGELVKSRAGRIFRRLAEAEAAVHGTEVEKIHFHEVGAVDSIIDIVGTCIGLDLLAIEKFYCSELATGSGSVHCAHGTLPVPAPATVQLLVGIPTKVGYTGRELTTPTGAAILTTLCEGFGNCPDMRSERIGCGAGREDLPGHPNMLRIIIGKLQAGGSSETESDQIWLLETNLDDASGELIGPLYEALLSLGALDVYVTPIQMKKNRPGVLISVLVGPEKLAEIEDALFESTPTFGLRRHLCQRSKLTRRTVQIQTPYGEIRVKVGLRGTKELTAAPEFEDCKAAACNHSVSPREIYNEALACYRKVKSSECE
ncbi:MAG: nickel pincer cofactor biosynthesis protein LarC [Actinobacteria bacterium]|nr:nickel pincer cofactor biosynthesis protein LarC [Actinomycetota bacterium]